MLAFSTITLRVEGRVLIENASAAIATGHKVGFVGRNGTGKSTLLRAITGEIQPDTGTITMARGARLGIVAQEAPGGPETLIETVLAADKERASLLAAREAAADPLALAEIEERLAAIRADSAPARAAAILAGLGFSAEAQGRPCAEFSGGWRMRVALAGVLFSEPDVLLLDEPTNYLDLEGVLWLETFLARYPHTVLLVSHDRDLLNRCVGHILHLEQKKLTLYTGTYDIFEKTRAEKIALQEAARVKQEAQRRHMQAFVDRFRYKASKARQAQSRLKAIAKLQPIAAFSDSGVAPFRFIEPEKLSPPLISIENASVGYGGPPVLSRLSMRIDTGDRIALLGANGNGKSTFAKFIAGRLPAQAGTISRHRKLKVGFFAQHQLDDLHEDETAVQHLARLLPRAADGELRTKLGAVGFSGEKADTPAGALSGGEKARLLMALATFDAPQLLILDEPTNHLDVDSREALVMALNAYEGAVILISHDRHLVETTADQLWLVDGGRVQAYDGDLEDYRRLLLAKRGASPARDGGEADARVSKADLRRAAAERRQQAAPLKKAADAAEREVTALTAERARLEAALHDPALYAKEPQKAAALSKQKADVEKALAAAEERWLEAAAAYEEAVAE